jgi:enamine deaminase RidA (YjgF/YER057c/UK114 family)
MLLPIKDGSLMATGKIGKEVSIEQAGECLKAIVINALAIVKSQQGSLDNLSRCVRLTGYLATAEDFYDHPRVMNYASALFNVLFGNAYGHTRGVVGVSSLPLNSPVAIDIIFELNGTGADKD